MLSLKHCIISIVFVSGVLNLSDRPVIELISSSYHKKVTSLNLSNNNLLRLRRGTFNNYDKELEQLDIINSKVRIVDDGAFYNLTQLQEVNLAKNFITSLKSNIFPPDNKLRKFIVAENNLKDLDNFDIHHFPKMQLLDISSNKIETLPISLAKKLSSDKNFIIMVNNNPWNCTKNWASVLDSVSYQKFCLEQVPVSLPLKESSSPKIWNCIFWFVGAFWIGIIVGNVPLLKRLLCVNWTPEKRSQSIQFDYVGEQRKMSGEGPQSNHMYMTILTHT